MSKKYKIGDLVYATNSWWCVTSLYNYPNLLVESTLWPKNTGSLFMPTRKIEHHVTPKVSNPCEVMPGPRTL